MNARFRARISDFFFAPASALPLAVLRVGLASILLTQAYFVSTELSQFYGPTAYLRGGLGFYPGPALFDLRNFLALTKSVGLDESQAIHLLGVVYLLSLATFLVGWKTRLATFTTWVTHMFWWNGQVSAYGLDIFAHQTLFLLLWMPAGDRLSLDALLHPKPCLSWSARLSLRVLQIQLCIAYLWSGLEKMRGTQWWSGEAIWRSLMLPIFAQHDMSWMAHVPWLARLLGWGTLVIETGYCVFIWPRRTRRLWCSAAIAMHCGIALFLGLWLFALIMILLNVSLFLIPPASTRPERVTRAATAENPQSSEGLLLPKARLPLEYARRSGTPSGDLPAPSH